MRIYLLIGYSLSCLVLVASLLSPALVAAEGRLIVTADLLSRRTCPSTDCGIVGYLLEGEGVTVFERKGGWGRITRRYQAACVEGLSDFVEKGNARCVPSNGIVAGKFAEWVSLDYLASGQASRKSQNPTENLTESEKLVAQSDSFNRHRTAFGKAVDKLLVDGTCSRADFKEMGGWLKATGPLMQEPVFFIYCGGFHVDNRYYLDAETGRIFQR